MSKVNFAASRQVNPAGALPKLSEEQIWKGLAMKARDPQSFVAVISSCHIVSDENDKIVRSVTFGDGQPVREEVELFKGTIAYFEVPEHGHRITNILSYDENNELVLTFSFAGGIPGSQILNDSPSAVELNQVVGVAVDKTIKRIRELVKENALL